MKTCWSAERLDEFILVTPEKCWQWQGYIDRDGYGRYAGYPAHREVYASLRGDLPSHVQLDHLCRNRACVNPDHLEPVSIKINVHRSLSPTGINARKTHCKHGHEFTEGNTYRWRHSRICRTCMRERRTAK